MTNIRPQIMGDGPNDRRPFEKGDRVRLVRAITVGDRHPIFDPFNTDIAIPIGMQGEVEWCNEVMVQVMFDGWATSETHHNFRFELMGKAK